MSADNSPSFDDLEPVEVQNDDDGSNWIDLGPGEQYVGQITGFNPDAGFNGVVELDGRPMYLNSTLKNQLLAALVEGETMAVRVSEDERTFEDDDGETQTFYPKEARF